MSGKGALAKEAMKSMFLTKLKIAAAGLLALGLTGAGTGVMARGALACEQGEPTEQRPATPPPQVARVPKPTIPETVQPKSLLDQALQATRDIADERQRAETLQIVAMAQKKAGEDAAAATTLQQALKIVDNLKDDPKDEFTSGSAEWYKAEFLARLAGRQADAGDLEAALKTANSIPLPHKQTDEFYFKAAALSQIANAQVQAGNLKGALKTAAEIKEDEKYEGHAYSTKDSALLSIAQTQAKSGEVKAAQATARLIGGNYNRVFAFCAIASAQKKLADAEGAEKTIREAQRIAEREGEENGTDFKSQALAEVAGTQAKMGNVTVALKLAEALPKSKESEDKNHVWDNRARALHFIATAQAETGDVQGALETAKSVEGPYWKSHALRAIAAAQAQARDRKGALETIKSHLQSDRVHVLIALARAEAQAGDRKTAVETLREALRACDRIGDEPDAVSEKGGCWIDIARAQAELGDEREAVAWVAKLSSPQTKAIALARLTECLVKRTAKEKQPAEKK